MPCIRQFTIIGIADDLKFVIAARGWSQCVRFGSFEDYKRRFEPRFEEAGKLGSKMIHAVIDLSYERRGGKKTLGALSDCRITISIINMVYDFLLQYVVIVSVKSLNFFVIKSGIAVRPVMAHQGS